MWRPKFLTRRPQREIFRYWDGEKMRAVDPMQVARIMDEHPQYNAGRHPGLVDEGDADATAVMLSAIRAAFDVTEWREDRPGLTQLETIKLYADFTQYTEGLKKNTVPSPTQPLSMGPTSTGSSGPTTSGIADSVSSQPAPT